MTDFVADFSAVKPVIVEDFDGSSLRAFKDCHRGERCFIIGNGPSLKRTELAPLCDEITFGVNGIFYMTQQCGFAPTYYVVEDNHVFEDNLTRINSVDAVAKFYPSKFRPVIKPSPDTHFLPTDWGFYWGSSPWYEKPRFSHDVAKVIYTGQTVTFLNIQLAAYMGCSEIYLIGVDFDYKIPDTAEVQGLSITSADDDPNHFHPEYFGKGKKWHLPKLDNVGLAMECARDGVAEAGGAILNATVGGRLEVFPRADYRQLVGRPELEDPNRPAHFLLSRALESAARVGATSVGGRDLTPTMATILAASPLEVVDVADGPDVVVAGSGITDPEPADHGHRTLLVGGDERPDERWLTRLLVDCLLDGRSMFWTRGVLELSPDAESILIPGLGRTGRRHVDATLGFGVDGLGDLDSGASTRWVDGRSMSIGGLADAVHEIVDHGHSMAIVDGQLYVQSTWRPVEAPKALWTTRRGTRT